MHEPGWYDLVHSHYWLSGQVGWLAEERWGVPLVHTMHTLAKVKNLLLAEDDAPEPAARVLGEEQVVAAADRLVANTADEARELVDLYGADPGRVDGRQPRGGPHRLPARAPGRGPPPPRTAAGRPRAAVRRPHPAAEGPGRAAARRRPDARRRPVASRSRLVVAFVGGPSGSGLARPE